MGIEGLESEVLQSPLVQDAIRQASADAVKREQDRQRAASADSDIADAAAKIAALVENPRARWQDLDRELTRALDAQRRKAGR